MELQPNRQGVHHVFEQLSDAVGRQTHAKSSQGMLMHASAR